MMKLFSRAKVRVLTPRQINAAPVAGEIQALGGHCMGTSWSVRLVDEGRDTAGLQARIAARLEVIEAQMSHFRPESDLCRFGRLPAGATQTLPTEFAHVLRAALEVAGQSAGAFDPTVARLVDAWGFGAAGRYSDPGFTPAAAEIAARREKLTVDEAGRIIQPGGVALNLAAIAKGYAVDAVAQMLTEAGFRNHLVEVGGELRGSGVKPDAQPWWVALELPTDDCPLPATRIALHGLSVATSGDYRRCYQLGQQRVQHTMDPRSGAPLVNRVASVTVLHRECMYADAWATALMVLGLKEGLALASKLELAVLMQALDEQNRWVEVTSPAWQNLQS
jgi:FAD:protein FMN transferase